MPTIIGDNGNNNLPGTPLDDVIWGLGGNDTLNGLGGNDTLRGGMGNDTYIIDGNGVDTIIENLGEGTDTVQSSITFSLNSIANVENLTLTGAGAINGTGNSLGNIIQGNNANNTIDGLGGVDWLYGNGGNDSLWGFTGSDFLFGGAGDDTLRGESDHDWLDGGDNNDTLYGGSGADSLYGGNGDDNLYGDADNDWLLGQAGVDTLRGGTGDDTYVLADADTVIENAGEGTDRVQSSISYTLTANVEHLTLTGVAAINGTGNTLNNFIIGNSAANSLNGGFGNDTLEARDGNDTLNGGFGNDVMWGEGGNDTLIGGNPLIINLPPVDIEPGPIQALVAPLVLSDNDILRGGIGNDTYVITSTGDTVIENFNEGFDTVQSAISYSLGANVENLTLSGTAAINGAGNALANSIIGNTANNVLSGGDGGDYINGGGGADIMDGGAGNDTYVTDGGDTITEAFGGGTDWVYSSVSYTLGANVEHLVLTGAGAINGSGNTLNNSIYGNGANNTLSGSSGDDYLSGGAGADRYSGGSGKDTMVFDATDVAAVAAGVYQGGIGSESVIDHSGDKVTFGSGQTLDLTALADDRILGIEMFDLTGFGNNTLKMNVNDVFAASDNDDVRVDGNAGDTFTSSAQGWAFGGNVLVGANLYEHYTFGTADLYVDTDVGGVVS